MASLNFKPLKEFEPGANPSKNYERWQEQVEKYWAAVELKNKPVEIQRVLHIMDETAYETLTSTEFQERTII